MIYNQREQFLVLRRVEVIDSLREGLFTPTIKTISVDFKLDFYLLKYLLKNVNRWSGFSLKQMKNDTKVHLHGFRNLRDTCSPISSSFIRTHSAHGKTGIEFIYWHTLTLVGISLPQLAQFGADLASDAEVGVLSHGKVWQGTAESGMYKQGLAWHVPGLCATQTIKKFNQRTNAHFWGWHTGKLPQTGKSTLENSISVYYFFGIQLN